MKLYLKLSGTTIIGYDFLSHDDYQTEIEIDGLPAICSEKNEYQYKYIDGVLVALSEQEILDHPINKIRKAAELKDKTRRDIAALEELKAHSISIKKSEGNALSVDEQAFLTNFLTQRQAILDQYELDKAQYE